MTRPTLRTALLAFGAATVGWVLRDGVGEARRPAPPQPFHVAVACECRGACVEEPCRVVLRRDGAVVLVPENVTDAPDGGAERSER